MQVFAVMQSIKLINGHTPMVRLHVFCGAATILTEYNCRVAWSNIRDAIDAKFEITTPGCIAPILINPFVEGGYLPKSGLGLLHPMKLKILTLIAKGLWGNGCASLYGFHEPYSTCNKRVDSLASPGDAFTGFLIQGGIKSTVRTNYSLLVSMEKCRNRTSAPSCFSKR